MTERLCNLAADVDATCSACVGYLRKCLRHFGQRKDLASPLSARRGHVSLRLETLETRQLLTGVVINEIHYDPAARDVPAEFIELYNAGPTPVDLTGWHITGGVDFSFPPGTMIDSDASLVVAQDLDGYDTAFGSQATDNLIAYAVPAGTSGFQNYGGALGMDFVVNQPIAVAGLGAFDSDGNGFSRTITTQLWSRDDRGTSSNPSDDRGIDILLHRSFTDGDGGTLVGGSRFKPLDTPLVLVPGAYTIVTFGYGSGELLFNGGAGGAGSTNDGRGAVAFVGTSRYGSAGSFPTTVDQHPHQYAAGTFRFDVVVAPPVFGPAIGPWDGRLSNDGERLVLQDAMGDTIDEVTYAVGFPWPTSANGEGSSMELLNPGLDNDLGGSWRSSTGLPTPGLENSTYVANAGPQTRQVNHRPESPVSDQDVIVTAKVTDPDGLSEVRLEYQSVDPGNYIRLSDTTYGTGWTTVTMTDDGTSGDITAGDDVFAGVLPGSLHTHRRLIRYRLTVTDGLGVTSIAPYADDPQPNFAYFVYDGIPAWNGADLPGITNPVTYGTDVMRSLPALHLIANESDVIKSQYNGSFNNVHFQGTLVYDDVVYDHVEFKNRGQNSTYVSGKNKWKLFFNRGHYFQGHDDDGTAWDIPVAKLNMGALAVPWAPPMRGLAGLDEAIALKLFNLAGVAAPKTQAMQLRVVDNSVEADPGNQYEGDLWGLYLAFEDPDGRFLDEHGLPDGNLFRMQGGATEIRHRGVGLPGDLSDVNTFVSSAGYNKSNPIQPLSWWRENVDMLGYYSYRSVVEAVNHSDIRDRENMLLYFNAETSKWSMLPWDLDLLYEEFDRWGPDGVQNHSALEQFRKALQHSDLNLEFQNRARELQDLLLNGDQLWQVIDEYAQLVAPMTAVDRAMWDYHPRTTSAHRGAYYQAGPVTYPVGNGAAGEVRPAIDPVGFQGMVNLVKAFTVIGGFGGDQLEALHEDPLIPVTPTITAIGAPFFPSDDLTFQTSLFNDPQGNDTFAALQWRLAEITRADAQADDSNSPISYEVNAVWDSGALTTFIDTFSVPGGSVRPGHAYRTRVRMRDNSGRWSHWSDPVEFIATAPVGALARGLRITEVNYHPHDALPVFGEQPVDGGEFEFIELVNAGQETLDLSQVALTDGIEFDFADSSTTMLAPGEYVLVVNNQVAFESRYGPGQNIAGEFAAGKLSNSGERIRLSDAQTGTIIEFSYNDAGKWPGRADGKGATLEVVDTAVGEEQVSSRYGNPENWRSSNEFGGSPGTAGTGPVFDVLVNEVLSRGSPPAADRVELINTTDSTIDLHGWHLTNTHEDPFKFTFGTDVTIGPGEYLVVDEDQLSFGLDGELGDDIWLLEGDPLADGRPLRFADHHGFDATAPNVSLGRVPDANATAQGASLFPMTSQTFGMANSRHAAGDLLISEVHYHLPPIAAAGQDDLSEEDLEFVELHNSTAASQDMGGWVFRQTDGDDFVLPTGTAILPNSVAVLVGFDPGAEPNKTASFREFYDIDGSVPMIGAYGGRLNNAGETLTLLRPEAPGNPQTGFVLVDRMAYDDAPPWATEADGGGPSLTRVSVGAFGNFATSWITAEPTPGSESFVLAGDLDGDGQVNGLDVDPFVDILLNSSYNTIADMNQDGAVNGLDVEQFVAAVVGAGGAAGVEVFRLSENDLATRIEQPGAASGEASISRMVERVGNRAPELHRHVRDLHEGDDHRPLTDHRAVGRVFGRRSRLKDRHRVPTDEANQRMHLQHALVGDWQATVDSAFGDDTDWIG